MEQSEGEQSTAGGEPSEGAGEQSDDAGEKEIIIDSFYFFLYYCCIFVIIFYFYIQPLKSHFPIQPFNQKGDNAGHKSKICSQVSFVYPATAPQIACPRC